MLLMRAYAYCRQQAVPKQAYLAAYTLATAQQRKLLLALRVRCA